jgi:hypothetical protein
MADDQVDAYVAANFDNFWKKYDNHRKYSVCLVGTTEVTAKLQRKLRESLFTYCERYKDRITDLDLSLSSELIDEVNSENNLYGCYVNRLLSHSSNVVHYSTTSNLQTNRSESPLEDSHQNIYESCRLCLTPGGDFPTRKGFLDAMLSGCIPVVFQVETAGSQWQYHWKNIDNIRHSMHFVPRDDIIGSNTSQTIDNRMKAIFEGLVSLSLNRTFLEEKLTTIARIGTRFQYFHLPQLTEEHHELFAADKLDVSKLSTLLAATKLRRLEIRREEDKDAFEVAIDLLSDIWQP